MKKDELSLYYSIFFTAREGWQMEELQLPFYINRAQ
jgi:hypothetical protein